MEFQQPWSDHMDRQPFRRRDAHIAPNFILFATATQASRSIFHGFRRAQDAPPLVG